MVRFTATPFTLRVLDIEHRPGEMREQSFTVAISERMGEGLVSVPAGASIRTDARLESLHEGILVSAHVDTVAHGVCGRCLTDIELPVQVDFQELFAYSSDEAFDFEVHDDHVDVEPLVRDAVVLALPFQPVCRPDCPGLDPETGERLANVSEREPQQPIDPRWAALAGFGASTDLQFADDESRAASETQAEER